MGGISVINHHSTRPTTAKMRTVTREASTAAAAAAAKTKMTTRAQVLLCSLLMVIYRYTTNGHHDDEEEGGRRTAGGGQGEDRGSRRRFGCVSSLRCVFFYTFFCSTKNHLQLDNVSGTRTGHQGWGTKGAWVADASWAPGYFLFSFFWLY